MWQNIAITLVGLFALLFVVNRIRPFIYRRKEKGERSSLSCGEGGGRGNYCDGCSGCALHPPKPDEKQ